MGRAGGLEHIIASVRPNWTSWRDVSHGLVQTIAWPMSSTRSEASTNCHWRPHGADGKRSCVIIGCNRDLYRFLMMIGVAHRCWCPI